MKALFLTIIVLLLAGVIAFFAFQNPEVTTIQLFKYEWEASKWLIFIGCTLVGFVIALIWAVPTIVAEKLRVATLRRKITKMDKELGKKDKTINSKDAQIGMKDDALEELSDELTKQEKIQVIRDAFLPKSK